MQKVNKLSDSKYLNGQEISVSRIQNFKQNIQPFTALSQTIIPFIPTFKQTSMSTPLQFSKQTILFTYIQKSHLKTSLTLTNNSDQFAYYKFKITQPKYYLIKQDKGTIKPKEVLAIDIILHKDGVSTACSDKIKCFYTLHNAEVTEEPENFERRSDTKTQKFTIRVDGIPLGMQQVPNEMKSSQVKSMQKSQSQFGKVSKMQDSLSLQKQIQQKEQEIVKIKNEMSTIRSTMHKTDTAEKAEPLSALGKFALVGLFLGFVISFTVY